MNVITIIYQEDVEISGQKPERVSCDFHIDRKSYDAVDVGTQRKMLQSAVDMVISQVDVAKQMRDKA